jgi:hypothetical protein
MVAPLNLQRSLNVSNLFLLLVIAFVIIVFAIALLAIGWLIKGKTRVEKVYHQEPDQKKEDQQTPPNQKVS